jgi:hypothetical protein
MKQPKKHEIQLVTGGGVIQEIAGDKILLSPAEQEQMRVVTEIGEKIIQKTGEVGTLYRSLVQYLRTAQVAPRFVTHWLTEQGFHKVRVSEINRVAQAPDDVYTDFMAKSLSFKDALTLARLGTAGEAVATPALQALAKDDASIEKAFEDIEAEVIAEASGSGKGGTDDKTRMARAVNIIFKLAKRSQQWRGDGWVLSLGKTANKPKKTPAKSKGAQPPAA